MTLDQKIEFIANKAYEQATSRRLIMAYNKQSIRLLDEIVNTLLYLRNIPRLLKNKEAIAEVVRSLIGATLETEGEDFINGLLESISTANELRRDGRAMSEKSATLSIKYDYSIYNKIATKMMLNLDGRTKRGLKDFIHGYRDRVEQFERTVEIMPDESLDLYRRMIAYDVIEEYGDINELARIFL